MIQSVGEDFGIYNNLPDTDMTNGGFRDLLGVKKMRKC